MKYDNNKYMTDHKTDKIMRSTHIDRRRGNYIPWSVIVQEHNRKPKVVIDRRARGWKSQPNVFMGC